MHYLKTIIEITHQSDDLVAKTLYLEGQVFWAGMFILFFGLSGKARKLIFLGALGAIPLAFIGFVFKEVWKPVRVMEGFIGIEDIVFCFISGGLSMALVNWVIDYTGPSLRIYFRWRRMLLTAFWGTGIMIFLFLMGIGNYLNSYLGMVLTVILLIALEGPLWKVFLAGSACFLIFYTIGLQLGFLFWPDLIRLWSVENMTGIRIGRVPLEELIWAFLFGGTWPMIVLYVSGPAAVEFKWKKFRALQALLNSFLP